MFKKNDETLDNSTCDDAEAGPSSPAANTSPEETGSELAKDERASDEDNAQGVRKDLLDLNYPFTSYLETRSSFRILIACILLLGYSGKFTRRRLAICG